MFLCGCLLLWSAILEILPGPRWYGTGAKLASLALVWVTGLYATRVGGVRTAPRLAAAAEDIGV
jgi:hypothetical protein